jgi:hypothetical protein
MSARAGILEKVSASASARMRWARALNRAHFALKSIVNLLKILIWKPTISWFSSLKVYKINANFTISVKKISCFKKTIFFAIICQIAIFCGFLKNWKWAQNWARLYNFLVSASARILKSASAEIASERERNIWWALPSTHVEYTGSR